MAAHSGVWGIDVGQCALKAVRMQVINGEVTATAFDYVEHPKILSQPDADPDQLTREALEKFLERNSIRSDTVVMSVPGQSGLARFVKLPPVEEKKIPDIVRFEAKQQIPFPLDEVVWDYQKVGVGEVMDGFATDTEIGLFAMKRDMVLRFLGHFQAVNVEVHIVQMAPLSLINYTTYDLLGRGSPAADYDDDEWEPERHDDTPKGKKRCLVALDVGTDNSNLVITDGGKVLWQRPIPIGGSAFTRALTKDMKLTFAKAEHLKRNAAKSPELPKILKSLKPVLTDFVNEVQRSLSFFMNANREAHVPHMIGLGNAFRLPGLQKFLQEKLNLEVRKPSRFERLSGESVTKAPVFGENLLSFPVAYGLGLQGLRIARIKTNLLPAEIQWERQVRAKKPWAVAGAACLLLGSGTLAMGYGLNYKSVRQQIGAEKTEIGKAISKGDAALKSAQSMDSQCSSKDAQVLQAKNELRSIIAGKYERRNWIGLTEYIDSCLPVPDGSNIRQQDMAFQQEFFFTQQSRNAAEKHKSLIQGTAPPDTRFEDELRTHLAMVDLEAISTQWTDNLTGYFEQAKLESAREFAELAGMREDDKANPPQGAGWVVELRGSTQYAGSSGLATRDFLIKTLVHNLASRARPAAPANPASADPSAPAVPGQPPGAPGVPPAPGLPRAADAANQAEEAVPILNNISHVFLYAYKPNPSPTGFVLIDQSVLPTLLAPAQGMGGEGMMPGGPPGGAAPGMPGGMPGMEGAGAQTQPWAPLGEGSSAGGGEPFGRGGRGGRGDRGERGNPFGPGRPAVGRPVAGVPGSEGPIDINAAKKGKIRYEFIVLLVWKEPVRDIGDGALGGVASMPASPGMMP